MALPKDPRQLMINLMYLVLTAMLALNITKEVLTAFQTINTSIEGSITSISGKNATFYSQIQKLYDDPATKDKAANAQNKATQIKAQSLALMAYLNGLKDTVINRSGGWEFEGKSTTDSVMKGLDNIDVPTKFFVDGKEGDSLKTKMNAFKSFLVTQVDPSFQSTIGSAIPISISNFKTSDENPSGDWAYGTFHNIPVVATVAMISKFQNDVKNSESIVLQHLYSQIGIDDIRFDSLRAIATPNTTYALEGQEIQASIILAAYSKSVNPDMGPGIPVTNGEGILKFKATGSGKQTKSGVIKFTKNGKVQSFDYHFDYMVGSAGASLQLDNMSVMYIGVDNPVSLSASGYNIEDVTLDFVQPGITKTVVPGPKGHYNVRVTNPGMIDWKITGTRQGSAGAGIGAGKIKVKYIPDPTATVSGRQSGSIDAATLKAQIGVSAAVVGFDWNTPFLVTEFRFYYIPRVGDAIPIDVKGNKFTPECRKLMDRSKAGDKWLFDAVKAVGPDKRVRPINSVFLTLK
jgi:gliding motility-associated protein GldM